MNRNFAPLPLRAWLSSLGRKLIATRVPLLRVPLVLLLAGCYKIEYDLAPERTISSAKTHYRTENTNSYFVFGLVPGESPRTLQSLCGSDDLVAVKSSQQAKNVAASLLSLTLASSSNLEAECAKRRRPATKEYLGLSSSSEKIASLRDQGARPHSGPSHGGLSTVRPPNPARPEASSSNPASSAERNSQSYGSFFGSFFGPSPARDEREPAQNEPRSPPTGRQSETGGSVAGDNGADRSIVAGAVQRSRASSDAAQPAAPGSTKRGWGPFWQQFGE